jgi:hypothetical protein
VSYKTFNGVEVNAGSFKLETVPKLTDEDSEKIREVRASQLKLQLSSTISRSELDLLITRIRGEINIWPDSSKSKWTIIELLTLVYVSLPIEAVSVSELQFQISQSDYSGRSAPTVAQISASAELVRIAEASGGSVIPVSDSARIAISVAHPDISRFLSSEPVFAPESYIEPLVLPAAAAAAPPPLRRSLQLSALDMRVVQRRRLEFDDNGL